MNLKLGKRVRCRSTFAVALQIQVLACFCASLAGDLAAAAEKTETESNKPVEFSLTRSLVWPNQETGASLGFPVYGEEGLNMEADFSLAAIHKFNASDFGAWAVEPRVFASGEGHVATGDAESENVWRFRLGGRLDLNYQPGTPARAWNESVIQLLGAAKYEADRDFKTQNLVGEFLVAPIVRALPGTLEAWPARGPVQFYWTPTFGLDAGRNLRRGVSAETDNTILRFLTQVDARIFSKDLNERLGLEGDALALFLQYKWYYLPREDRTTHDLFVVGVEWRFYEMKQEIPGLRKPPELGLQVAYTVGEDAPTFEKGETVEIGLSCRF